MDEKEIECNFLIDGRCSLKRNGRGFRMPCAGRNCILQKILNGINELCGRENI